MPKLSSSQKTFVVGRLACYHSPSEVADMLKEEYGVTVPRQQVALYDPNKPAAARLCAELRKLFEETRSAFLADTESIPIAQRNYRLRELQALYEANKKRSPLVAAAILKQAAQETGQWCERSDVTSAGIPVKWYSVVSPEDL